MTNYAGGLALIVLPLDELPRSRPNPCPLSASAGEATRTIETAFTAAEPRGRMTAPEGRRSIVSSGSVSVPI